MEEEFDNTNAGTIVVVSPSNLGAAEGVDDDDAHDSEMIDAANAINTIAEIGGRAVIYCLIYDTIHEGTINQILKFHQQRNKNDKARRIKAAFTSPRLSKVGQCIASVIANEPPPSNASPLRIGQQNDIQNHTGNGALYSIARGPAKSSCG